ncbi:MAG: ornithine cyclodeaminase family protein [Acidobacteria bacterium]|nr:ornithine cyclodeaminase family protein [Acidobacteriota bacterium]
MLLFTESDVRRLLSMKQCIGVLRDAFQAYAHGEAQNQPRRRLVLPTGSVLHQLAGAYGNYFGIKYYSTNTKHGFHFLFTLFDAPTGKPLAIFEANYLGQIRTGAASGLATSLMTSPSPKSVAIIGSGFQAESQLAAMLAIRELTSVKVWSRSERKRVEFAADSSELYPVHVEAAATAQEAVEGADIVITATWAGEPVLEADWVKPGAHVNAMGSNNPGRRELPAELVRRATVLAADSVEQCRLEAGDYVLALDDAGWERVVELKDLVARGASHSPGQLTIFKSVGLGLEDVAAAAFVYEQATQQALGVTIPLLV